MKRSKALFPKLLLAAGLTAALIVPLMLFSSLGSAQTAAEAQYAPSNTTPPSISGTATDGNVLTANPGVWTEVQGGFTYQWLRCNTTGAACAAIGNATQQTYTLTTADAGATVRVRVTARNANGSTDAESPQTALVQPKASTPPPTTTTTTTTTTVPSSGKTVQAAAVALPSRLVVDRVRFNPRRLSSRAPFVGQFHVSTTGNQSVQGALVFAIGLPYAWSRTAPETTTDTNGWATVTFRPTRNMPLRFGTSLVIFVRARVPGQNLLAGASTRRLVQVTVR
jgi:hypothetical protein